MNSSKNKYLITTIISIAILSIEQVSCLCRYRNFDNLPRDIFSYWASWGCYIFTRSDLFVNEPLQASICSIKSGNEVFNTTGLKIQDDCIPFDYSDERVAEEVRKTFRSPITFKKWIDCSVDALFCCDDVMMNDTVKGNDCPSVWDGWSCFDSVPTGQTYKKICPKYAYATEPPQCLHYSYKYCNPNGNWTLRTDYSSCDITFKLLVRVQYHISMLMISIIVCTPAVIILIFDQQLQTQKLKMIRNFLIAIVMRNFFIILVKSILILDEIMSVEETVMDRNPWPCKLLSFFEIFAGNVVFTFMLLKGIYLHQLLTNVFRSRQSNGPNMMPFYIIGGIISVCSAVIWAIIMVFYNDQFCWQLPEEGYLSHWCYDTPRLLMLIINLILLIHIIIRLWNTFKNKESEHHPNMRTVKVALICSPLFGVPFFFTLFRPDTDSCDLEQFYYFSYYTIEASQGILVAILHCYRERDVKKSLRILFDRFKSYVHESSYWKRRSSSLTDSDTRRTTISGAETPEEVPKTPTKRILKINQSNKIEIEISDNETSSPLARYNLDSSEIMGKKGKESESPCVNWSDNDKIHKAKQVQFQ